MCPHRSKVVRLAGYSRSGFFHTREEAIRIIELEELDNHAWAEIDFSGISNASFDFIVELFPVHPDRELRTWLSPRNYSQEIGKKLAGYFCKLKYQRESWSKRAFDPSWHTPSLEALRESVNKG